MNKKWFIGIDISKLSLDVAIHSDDGGQEENHIKVNNDIPGFKKLLEWLKEKKVDYKQSLFCMEHTGLYGLEIQFFLTKKEITYCMESPLQIKRSLGLVRGKNDKVDAQRIAWYAYTFRDRIKASHLPPEALRILQRLLTLRKHYVKQIVSFRQHKSDVIKYETKQASKRKAKMLEYLDDMLSQVESQMMEIITADGTINNNYNLLLSIPGIGIINAITTIVNTQNFTAFANARQYACYIGIAPFEHTSGTSVNGRTSVSKLGNKQAKVELTQAARSAVIHDPGIKSYFQRKYNEKGATRDAYGIVLNAVKFKLLLRIFAVVKRGSKYVKLAYA